MLVFSMVSTKQSPYIEKPTKGVSPEWANLPRRKCDNCGKSYKPKQPLRKGQKYGFHTPECKKQFHKHGAAFIKLKDVCFKEMEKWKKDFEQRLREIVREEIAALDSRTLGDRPATTNGATLASYAFRRAR